MASIYRSAFAEPPWNAPPSTDKEIAVDLDHAQSQKDVVMLFAKINGAVVGFIWGYRIPLKEFQFLKSLIPSNSNYIDSLAVSSLFRKRGIGRSLVESYINEVRDKCDLIVTRTHIRNKASMKLFKSMGFMSFSPPIYDPVFASRIYLKRGVHPVLK